MDPLPRSPQAEGFCVCSSDLDNLQFSKDAFGGATNCDLKVYRRLSPAKRDLGALCNSFHLLGNLYGRVQSGNVGPW